MVNKQIEILAPGGSPACLKAAIDSGADAVYCAGTRFGARANAVNFTNEQIIEAIHYAHLRSALIYVTVNTLVSDSELQEVFDFLKFCYTAGADGVIVQDLGVVNLIKTYFPDMRIHASTQLTVHNLAGALQAQKMGFDRVVLSRELSFDEIKYIASNCDIELEVFVHGALCMSYSGQCLFSSFLGGRSGNRGSCAQPCRLPYTLTDSDGNKISEKEKYLLSLKDLCLVDYIGKLREIGVTSLKIEGRMKSETYVSGVTGMYNKYRNGGKVTDEDRKLLQNIFSRGGFTQGYYVGKYGRDMLSYGSNHDNIFDSATGDVVSQAKTFASQRRTVCVDAHFKAKLGEKPIFTVKYQSRSFTACGDNLTETASNAPVTAERITAQLSKLGGTVFEFGSLSVEVDDNIYISIKDINNLRREAFAAAERSIVGEGRVYEGPPLGIIKPQNLCSEPALSASVLNGSQAKKAYELGFDRIYIPYSVYLSDVNFYSSEPDVFAVKLPPVIHDSRSVDLSAIKTDAVCITNIGQLSMLTSGVKMYADYRLNAFNSLAIKQLMRMGVSCVTLSPELTIRQIKEMAKSIPAEVVVYGRISMMTVRNCIIKSAKNKCSCQSDEIYYLKDRKNINFPVITDKSSCTNVIYNSAPIVMSDRTNELKHIGAALHRFDFTTETPDEMERIVHMYEEGRKSDSFFTRGHFYKGVL